MFLTIFLQLSFGPQLGEVIVSPTHFKDSAVSKWKRLQNDSKTFRSQKEKTSQCWEAAGDHTGETGSARRGSGVWKLVLDYPSNSLYNMKQGVPASGLICCGVSLKA